MDFHIDRNEKRLPISRKGITKSPQSRRLRCALQASGQNFDANYTTRRNVKPGQVDSVTWTIVNTGEVSLVNCVLTPVENKDIKSLAFIHPAEDIKLSLEEVLPGETAIARLAYMAPMHKIVIERQYKCKSLETGRLFGPLVSLRINCDPTSAYDFRSEKTDTKEAPLLKRFDATWEGDEEESKGADEPFIPTQVHLGSRIYVNWNTHHGPTWFPGTVTAVQSAAQTVDILYDDGDERYSVPIARVRTSVPPNGRSTRDHDRPFLASDVHEVGDHVYTRFSRSWFPGVIVSVHEGGTFTVRYDDSEIQRRVRYNEIVSHPSMYSPTSSAPAPGSGTTNEFRWSRASSAFMMEHL